MADDGYLVSVANVSAREMLEREVGMVHEVLTQYGPVHRFWFDGTSDFKGDKRDLWRAVYDEIRSTSPSTMISSYRGDVCASTGSLYTNSGPAPNTTDTSGCGAFDEAAPYFHPTEMHGITIVGSMPESNLWQAGASPGAGVRRSQPRPLCSTPTVVSKKAPMATPTASPLFGSGTRGLARATRPVALGWVTATRRGSLTRIL